LGFLLSLALTDRLNSMFYSLDPEGHPLHYNFNPDLRVVLAVVVLSIGSGFVIGVIPALKSLRAGTAENLKRQSSTVSAGPQLGRWLVGAQAGIAVAFAAIAGLLITSAHAMIAGTNFEASHVALMRLRPRLIKYPPEKAQQFLRTVMEQLQLAPGVESASMVGGGGVLLGGSGKVSLPEWPDTQALERG